MTKFPEIKVQLTGTDGNAFAIMGKVLGAMKRAKVPLEDIEACQDKMMSGDYDNLLRTAMEYVEVS